MRWPAWFQHCHSFAPDSTSPLQYIFPVLASHLLYLCSISLAQKSKQSTKSICQSLSLEKFYFPFHYILLYKKGKKKNFCDWTWLHVSLIEQIVVLRPDTFFVWHLMLSNLFSVKRDILPNSYPSIQLSLCMFKISLTILCLNIIF